MPRGVAVTLQALPPQTPRGERKDRKMDAGLRLEMSNSTFVNGGKWEGSKHSEFGSKGSKENIFWFLSNQTSIISDSLPHELMVTATKMEDVPKPTC